SIHDVAGMSAFSINGNNLFNVLGALNSKVGNYILKILNPTINLQVGDLKRFPVINQSGQIKDLIISAIDLSKEEWDSFENSWSYKKHPILSHIVEHNLSPPSVIMF